MTVTLSWPPAAIASLTSCDVDLVQVGHGARVASERARDDRALRVDARLLGGDLPRLDQVGHEAVVAGQLLQVPPMEKVGARVADLGDDEPLPFEHGGGARGSHALAAAAFVGGFQDGVVGGLHGASERFGVGVLGCAVGQDADGDF